MALSQPNLPLAYEGSQLENKAATDIQRSYQGHRARRDVNSMRLAKEAKWQELVKNAEDRSYAVQQLGNENDVSSRWKRAIQATSRIQTGEGVLPNALSRQSSDQSISSSVLEHRKATFWGSISGGLGVGKERDETEELPYHSKALEQQHWLEMIDPKYYFRKWQASDTEDNFFRWLDRGQGKNLDLEEMPRERLEKERIIYLSAEQRLNYLVKVDKSDGKLRWAHNGELVDTRENKWRDAGEGRGIVPAESASSWKALKKPLADPIRASNPSSDGRRPGDYQQPNVEKSHSQLKGEVDPKHNKEEEDDDDDDDDAESSSLSSDYSAFSDFQDNEDTHYIGLDEQEKASWFERKKRAITPSGIRGKLLRKTLRRNTWIYVADMRMNLFIGIKQSGSFQHSSFLSGGKVTSAGLIVVKNGVIKSISPLSGHYRSSIDHYRSFIYQLEQKGADLSRVKIGKSVMTLWGLGKYTAFTRAQKDLPKKIKRAVGLSHEPTEAEKSAEVEASVKREEEENLNKLQEVKLAEETQDTDEARIRVRRQVLYGRAKVGKEA